MTWHPGEPRPIHFGRIDSFRNCHVLLTVDSRGLLQTPPAAIPTGPRAVVSNPAEEPEQSEHHQHGPQRPLNTEAHATEQQKDDDYSEK